MAELGELHDQLAAREQRIAADAAAQRQQLAAAQVNFARPVQRNQACNSGSC